MVAEELKTDTLLTHEEGLVLYNILSKQDPRNLCLNFSGIKTCHPDFLNSSIGEFIIKSEQINNGLYLRICFLPDKGTADIIEFIVRLSSKDDKFDIKQQNDNVIQLRPKKNYTLPLNINKELIGDCIEYLEVLDNSQSFYKHQILTILRDLYNNREF